MIKLAEIINQKIAYHVAESMMEDSIKKYGLNPKKYLGDITTTGKYVYVFLDYNEAYSYAETYKSWLKYQGEPEKDFDIWQVNIQGLKLEKDFTLNTGDDPMKDSAYMIPSPIEKNRLKLIKTI